jgi:hypothetical protein
MRIAKAQFGVGDHIRRCSLVSEVTFDMMGQNKLLEGLQIAKVPEKPVKA